MSSTTALTRNSNLQLLLQEALRAGATNRWAMTVAAGLVLPAALIATVMPRTAVAILAVALLFVAIDHIALGAKLNPFISQATSREYHIAHRRLRSRNPQLAEERTAHLHDALRRAENGSSAALNEARTLIHDTIAQNKR